MVFGWAEGGNDLGGDGKRKGSHANRAGSGNQLDTKLSDGARLTGPLWMKRLDKPGVSAFGQVWR